MDGAVIAEMPMQVIAAGQRTSVPVLIGTNLDEIRFCPALYDVPLEPKPETLFRKQLEVLGSTGSESRLGS